MFALRIPFSIILFAVIEREIEMVRKLEMEIGGRWREGEAEIAEEMELERKRM